MTSGVLSVRLPVRLSRAAAVADGQGGILVAGGLTASNVSATGVYRFDPTGPTITSTGKLHTGVHDTAAALVGARLVVFGGGTATGETATIQAAGSGSSYGLIGHLPSARSDHGAVGLENQGRVAVVGGFDGTSPSSTFSPPPTAPRSPRSLDCPNPSATPQSSPTVRPST